MTVPNGNVVVGNKTIENLQSNIAVSPIDPTGMMAGDMVTGTLHYITDFTAFDSHQSSDQNMGTGNFLALSISNTDGYTRIIDDTTNPLGYKNADIMIFKIFDTTRNIIIKFKKDDQVVKLFSIDLNSLILENF